MNHGQVLAWFAIEGWEPVYNEGGGWYGVCNPSTRMLVFWYTHLGEMNEAPDWFESEYKSTYEEELTWGCSSKSDRYAEAIAYIREHGL